MPPASASGPTQRKHDSSDGSFVISPPRFIMRVDGRRAVEVMPDSSASSSSTSSSSKMKSHREHGDVVGPQSVGGTVPPPPGCGAYNDSQDTSHMSSPQQQRAIRARKAWQIVMSAGKGLLPTAFMLWMTGNGVSMMTLMITAMNFVRCLQACFAVGDQFKPLEASDAAMSFLLPKICYVAVQLIGVFLVLYKCHSMGLLPTEADWAVFNLSVRLPEELTVGYMQSR
eukprot:CAMPEP_0177641374 /NCGR_PEP_ID=MMETSP0447-20121125/7031_1 /TAXON_ID=0 /ORGANISM="Stygamoeba regulata, Strain BSH-02190019" /LENGTH=226 /DNA_ID=CAMNT_0019143485 /DNA_START=50 /DNA_END=730 /DNA_ORIENTATION=+